MRAVALAVAIGLLVIAVLCKSTKAKQPHIVYFLIDDLGFNDIGYHDSSISTPTLDMMAKDGFRMENNYVAPACSPSRTSLMTGKNSWTLGENHIVLRSPFPGCLTKKYPILAESLRDLGYKNYMVGKWHMGFCNITCTPNARGFDDFIGYYNGFISYYTHRVDGYHDWAVNSEPTVDDIGKYAMDPFRDRTLENIKTHSAKHGQDTPMFLYFALPTVHTPMEAPGEYMDMYPEEKDFNRRSIKAMMTATDDVIAEIVEALKAADMWDNTIFIFSSDNGGEAGYSLNAPLRSAKASSFEGGVRVPGFVNSPLMKAGSKGKVSKGLFHITDWYPTIMNLAGGKSHSDVDGYDQTDFIMNGGKSARDVVPIHYDPLDLSTYGKKAIRSGKWKLIEGFPGLYDGYDSDGSLGLTSDKGEPAKRGQYNFDWAAITQYSIGMKDHIYLFDLETDPNETTNVAESHPDIVKKLQEDMQPFIDEYIEPVVTQVDPKSFPVEGTWIPGWC